MALHQLTVAEQDTLVVDPAAQTHGILIDVVFHMVELLLLAGEDFLEYAAEHAACMSGKACSGEQGFLGADIGEHLHACELHGAIRKHGGGIEHYGIGVIEIIHTLVAEHECTVSDHAADCLVHGQVGNESDRCTAAGRCKHGKDHQSVGKRFRFQEGQQDRKCV